MTSGEQLFRETTGDVVTVRGVLNNITFRNEDNGYTVARLSVEGADELLTIVGVMPGVQGGDSLALVGHWTSHKTYGRQFDVESCELRPPSGRAGLVRFLGSGRIKGVGPKTAEKIVDTLGPDVLSSLEQQPHDPGGHACPASAGTRLARSPISSPGAEGGLHRPRLPAGVRPRRRSRPTGLEAVRRPQTVELVRDNPYRLADEVFGIGFRTADVLARGLGHEVDSGFRIAAGLSHLLARAALEGHVGLPSEELIGRARALPGGGRAARRVRCWSSALGDGRLVEDGLVYHPDLHAAEAALADHVRRRLEDPRPLVSLAPEASVRHAEEIAGLELSQDQRDAIAVAVGSRFSVITGGPPA